jgi:hypothetical protein
MSVSDSDNADLFDGFGNGSHHLWVVCDPNWRPYDAGNAWYLELDFHVSDWKALFWDVLHCPEFDLNESREKNRELFSQSIPEYPMLGQIWDNYEDYVFTPEEIVKLRNECLKLKAEVTEPEAVKALRKLIYACDEASKAGCNLMFVCD